MARILFKGSTHFAGADSPAILAAADDLGYAAAEQGHTVLVGSESPNTIDRGLKWGLERFCQGFPERTVRMEVHRPDDGEVPFAAATPPNLRVERRSYGFPSTQSSPKHRNWVVAHVGALDASDLLVVVGGGSGTRLAGELAVERRWPLVPVASFGGAAQDLYTVVSFELRRQPTVSDLLHVLNAPWQPSSGTQVVSIAEAIVTTGRPHSYFISYSHADAVIADRVELLLRREHRSVLRDERELTPGAGIDRTLETRIASAVTFVAVYSRHYADSDYCMGELAVAYELRRGGSKPARIVALRADGTVLPPSLAAKLYLDANDRSALDKAVHSLLTTESRGSLDPPP